MSLLWEMAYIVVYAVILLSSLVAFFLMGTFVEVTPVIRTEEDLAACKRCVRMNMFMALVQMGLFVAGIGVGIILINRHGLIGLAAVLATNGLVFGVGKLIGSQEKKVRALGCATPELQAEHARICATWGKKALPDF